MSGLLFIVFNKSCTLAFIVFGTLSKISLSIKSCFTGSGATATGSPDISWNEKEELKYKGETVQESNVVELVTDVLSKRKYFNPQGWETFGEALCLRDLGVLLV
jgi:hypothetical protein